MASYVVTQRVSGGPTRRALAPTADAPLPDWIIEDDVDPILEPATVDIVGSDWWVRADEIWKQTTFYLFDTDGWR